MNFGETLAYWYLRLNGFVPLKNFVLHEVEGKDKNEKSILYSADCDLLAVRFPHVHEEIGGTKVDWDSDKFAKWGLKLDETIIGLIVEVKTGDIEDPSNQSFTRNRLTYGIKRLGFWEQTQAERIASTLDGKATYSESNFTVGKLLIASTIRRRRKSNPSYLSLSLEEIDKFLENRMEKYSDPKWASRMFFPDDLVQYIIWKRSQNLRGARQQTNNTLNAP